MRFFYYTIFLGIFSFYDCGGNKHVITELNSSEQILKEIYNLCEQPGYSDRSPFCLTHNLKNIRQIIKPYLNQIHTFGSEKSIYSSINDVLNKHLNISHFYIEKISSISGSDSFFDYKFAINRPAKCLIYDQYIYLIFIDFDFNWYKINEGLKNVAFYEKSIILDLRDNRGGSVSNLAQLLSYFIPYHSPFAYHITRKHEQFLGNFDQWTSNYSKDKMQTLINTIQSNGTLKNNLWDTNIIKIFYCFTTVKKKIAILINANSASCSEYFTMVLKEQFPERVKIIGRRSAGALCLANKHPLPHLGLALIYPVAEVISRQGTRIEGKGIIPDEITWKESHVEAIAKTWVTQEYKMI